MQKLEFWKMEIKLGNRNFKKKLFKNRILKINKLIN